MAQSNEGNKEPMKFPNANHGQGTTAKKNSSVGGSKSVAPASSHFKGPKQPDSGVMAHLTNKKAGSF